MRVRVLLSTYGSRGDIEPLVALALRLRERGAQVRVCVPPDEAFAQRLAGVGASVTPVGPSAQALTKAAPPPSSMSERAAQLIAAQFEAVGKAAEGCDAMMVTGMLPTAAGALSVAEKLGIRAVSVTFQQLTLPSPHRPPLAYPGRSFPPVVTGNRELWKLDAETVNELFGEALNKNRVAHGLPSVDDVRSYVVGDQPWLATDPVLDPVLDLDVVQTGAWIMPDDRPLQAELVEFLEAGPAPVYAGFGSMPMHAAKDIAQVTIDSIRAQGRRAVVLQGWADLGLIDDRDDCFVVGEVNQQALFRRVAAVVHHGGAGTTTTASRSGAPQVVVPQAADQPYWAKRVADLGIGVAHDGSVPTTESLSAALHSALQLHDRATEVAGTIRADGAAVAAKLLLEG